MAEKTKTYLKIPKRVPSEEQKFLIEISTAGSKKSMVVTEAELMVKKAKKEAVLVEISKDIQEIKKL